MFRFLLDDEQIQIPNWVVDLNSFRRWTDEDAFPETGQVSFIKGDVWVDISKEQLFGHNQAKCEINTGLYMSAKANRMGRYFMHGAFLSNEDADISNQPDGIFVSKSTSQQGLVRVVEGRTRGHVELEGTPDMVLEVVSDSSVEKDTVILRQAYAEAGIREYWLADARQAPLRFDIPRLTPRGYVAAATRAGWSRSEVFDRWFRLTQETGDDGFPQYTLEMNSERPR